MESNAHQSKVDTETAQVQAEQELRKEWGRDFEANVKRAGALAKANLNTEILDLELKNGMRVGDHPEMIKGFAKIANLLTEDNIMSPEDENASKTSDIESDIASIMSNKEGPYWNKQHPDHDKMVQQVYSLREMLNSK